MSESSTGTLTPTEEILRGSAWGVFAIPHPLQNSAGQTPSPTNTPISQAEYRPNPLVQVEPIGYLPSPLESVAQGFFQNIASLIGGVGMIGVGAIAGAIAAPPSPPKPVVVTKEVLVPVTTWQWVNEVIAPVKNAVNAIKNPVGKAVTAAQNYIKRVLKPVTTYVKQLVTSVIPPAPAPVPTPAPTPAPTPGITPASLISRLLVAGGALLTAGSLLGAVENQSLAALAESYANDVRMNLGAKSPTPTSCMPTPKPSSTATFRETPTVKKPSASYTPSTPTRTVRLSITPSKTLVATRDTRVTPTMTYRPSPTPTSTKTQTPIFPFEVTPTYLTPGRTPFATAPTWLAPPGAYDPTSTPRFPFEVTPTFLTLAPTCSWPVCTVTPVSPTPQGGWGSMPNYPGLEDTEDSGIKCEGMECLIEFMEKAVKAWFPYTEDAIEKVLGDNVFVRVDYVSARTGGLRIINVHFDNRSNSEVSIVRIKLEEHLLALYEYREELLPGWTTIIVRPHQTLDYPINQRTLIGSCSRARVTFTFYHTNSGLLENNVVVEVAGGCPGN